MGEAALCQGWLVHSKRSHGLHGLVCTLYREKLHDWADYSSYYKYVAPLTPVSHPDLRALDTNPGILSEEPVLTVTLLTIASRYMRLTGPGSQTRSMMVHERVLKYLQNMMTRMFWGQDQFGGGFCGAGARKRTPKGLEKGRLRTVGTIERYVWSLAQQVRDRILMSLQASCSCQIFIPGACTSRPMMMMKTFSHHMTIP